MPDLDKSIMFKDDIHSCLILFDTFNLPANIILELFHFQLIDLTIQSWVSINFGTLH